MSKFTEIPMRTWNWLGVNEAMADVESEVKKTSIKTGEVQNVIETNLASEVKARKLYFKLEDNSQLDLIVVDLGESDSYSEIVIDLDGDDAKVNIAAAYFGFGQRKLDLNYIIHQRGKRSEATMNVKGALSGESNKIFRGTLDFLRGAKGSVGREREEVIILADTVRNRSVPLMLSQEDEVDGHHAVSVGRIDENKLFYLMSRGLDKLEAEKLIVEAAFNPIIAQIDDEGLIDKISEIIERRLTDVK